MIDKRGSSIHEVSDNDKWVSSQKKRQKLL